jgi:hypothetical protein
MRTPITQLRDISFQLFIGDFLVGCSESVEEFEVAVCEVVSGTGEADVDVTWLRAFGTVVWPPVKGAGAAAITTPVVACGAVPSFTLVCERCEGFFHVAEDLVEAA